MIWLDRDLQWWGTVSGTRGRRPTFSDAAIQFFLTIKGLFGLALRQAMGMVESLLKLAGDPGDRGHAQLGGRCAGAAQSARADRPA